MVISHSHQFIFTHLYKTGGTSISFALSPYGHSRHSIKDRFLSMIGFYPSIYSEDYPKHGSLKELKREFPAKLFQGYFKFAFVRNAWDWQVSLYHYILQDPTNQHHSIVKKLQDFDQYLIWRTKSENIRLQQYYVCDDNGNLLTDFVGDCSNLNADMQKVFDHLGLGNLALPHLNKGNRASYKEYYSPKGRDLIHEAYKSDIKRFGFEF